MTHHREACSIPTYLYIHIYVRISLNSATISYEKRCKAIIAFNCDIQINGQFWHSSSEIFGFMLKTCGRSIQWLRCSCFVMSTELLYQSIWFRMAKRSNWKLVKYDRVDNGSWKKSPPLTHFNLFPFRKIQILLKLIYHHEEEKSTSGLSEWGHSNKNCFSSEEFLSNYQRFELKIL